MNGRNALALVTVLFFSGLLVGGATGRALANRLTDPYAGLDVLAQAMHIIETQYVDPVPEGSIVNNAIDGMVSQLDEHSDWMGASAVDDLREDTEGNFTGIGVVLVGKPDAVVISKVLPNSPAARDGVQPGDRVVAVDGNDVSGLGVEDVQQRISGERGVQATLELQRSAGTVTVNTVRDTVYLPAVQSEVLPDGTAYYRLRKFQRGSAEELTALMKEHQGRAVILDLRDNPGGLLREAVGIVDLFLDQGTIVTTRDRDSVVETHTASVGGPAETLTPIVLINRRSASGSEIVAGALKDTKRGILVGETTYGKGSVQQLYRNRDGSALKLTVARYHTPSGAPILDKQGIEPDHAVAWPSAPSPKDQLRVAFSKLEQVDNDTKLELLTLIEQLETPPQRRYRIPWEQTVTERLAADPQLAKAVELAQAL